MNFDELSFDELKVLAKSVEGVEIHHATGEVKYRAEFQAYVDDHPGCLENLKAPEGTPGAEGVDNATEDLDPEDITPEDAPALLKKRIAELEAELLGKSEEPVKEEDLVKDHKIKSGKFRGKISSSVGVVDFGEKGIAECTAKQYKHFLTLNGYEKC